MGYKSSSHTVYSRYWQNFDMILNDFHLQCEAEYTKKQKKTRFVSMSSE